MHFLHFLHRFEFVKMKMMFGLVLLLSVVLVDVNAGKLLSLTWINHLSYSVKYNVSCD